MIKLIESQEGRKVYKGYDYIIRESKYCFDVVAEAKEENKYLPRIYAERNKEEKIIDFTIQTTSYGSLNSEEIKKMIQGYEAALKVVEELRKMF